MNIPPISSIIFIISRITAFLLETPNTASAMATVIPSEVRINANTEAAANRIITWIVVSADFRTQLINSLKFSSR